ncbi:MAG: hypothetical protein ABFS45_18920 [Pseudomonadota bacterium]
MPDKTRTEVPRIQTIIAVLWPSFLSAGVAAIIFFTVFDPAEIFACMGGPEISRIGAYTLGFFMFWLLTASSCVLALYFNKPCPKIDKSRA